MASKKSSPKSGCGHLAPLGERPAEGYKQLVKEFHKLPTDFNVAEFSASVKISPVDLADVSKLNLVACFGNGADIIVERDLSVEQVAKVVAAKSLSVLKPSAS